MKTIYSLFFTAVLFYNLGSLQVITSPWQHDVIKTAYKEGQQDIIIAAIEQ